METREKSPTPLPAAPLETDRLVLRQWTDADIPQIFEICQDPEIRRWTTVPSPYQLKDAEWYVREWAAKQFDAGTEATFAVSVKETGQIAGAIALMGLAAGAPVLTGEVGFWANPATRGRGYLTEALRELVRWGFDDLGLHRIIWQAHDGNAASLRVAEKAGFTMVGKQRQSHRHQGERIDMWLADVLPTDPRP
jgi:RimJ/RimL family protein N-acetyltransferase